MLLNIPLALMTAVIALWLCGQTINLMTLGGLALAIGILVDEATVAIENIHGHLEQGKPLARAVLRRLGRDRHPTAVGHGLDPGRVHLRVLHAGSAPGDVRAPVAGGGLLDGRVLRPVEHAGSRGVGLDAAAIGGRKMGHQAALSGRLARRPLGPALGPLVASLGVSPLASPIRATASGGRSVSYRRGDRLFCGLGSRHLGRRLSPGHGDLSLGEATQFRLRLRAPDGTHIGRSEQIALQALDLIRQAVGPANIDLTLGYVGTIPSSYPINAVFQWTRGPEEAILWVALKRQSGIDVERLKQRLRATLGRELPGVRCSFEPADIVNEVMSFGSPTPIEVAVSGPNFAETRTYAGKLHAELAKIAVAARSSGGPVARLSHGRRPYRS